MTEQGGEQPVADEAPESTEDAPVISQWEFLDRTPTREAVIELLATLPDVWGVSTLEYADYVQALPQRKKSRAPHPDPARAAQGVTVEKLLDTHTLYMSVAGRLKMMEAAAEKHGWAVSFQPEPHTPTGIPGFLQNDERIVYREYVEVAAPVGTQRLVPVGAADTSGAKTYVAEMMSLGRKPGMAWVPSTGGKQAAGSNPYEKVETSARGRALAAWGFGVLPGSGVASLEEVLGSNQNRAAMDAEAVAGGGQQVDQRESREDLLSSTLAAMEALRQERGVEIGEATEKTAVYLRDQLGVRDVYVDDGDSWRIDWDKVRDGHLVLLRNNLRDTLRKIRDAGSDV